MEPPHPYGPKLQSKKKWPHDKTHLFFNDDVWETKLEPQYSNKDGGLFIRLARTDNNNNNIDFFLIS